MQIWEVYFISLKLKTLINVVIAIEQKSLLEMSSQHNVDLQKKLFFFSFETQFRSYCPGRSVMA